MPNFGFTTAGQAAPITGSAGAVTSGGDRGMPSAANGRAHIGCIGIVLLCVLGLVLLDRGGFRFVVTVGRRG